MARRSVVDEITSYLQEELTHHDVITLNRQDIATRFHCVPSQINYVMNTRFTKEKGYIVESKRGGSGYIRIQKLYFCVQHDTLQHMMTHLPETMTYDEGTVILQRLYESNIIDQKTKELLLIAIHPDIIQEEHSVQRSQFFKAILQRLQYK